MKMLPTKRRSFTFKQRLIKIGHKLETQKHKEHKQSNINMYTVIEIKFRYLMLLHNYGDI